MQEAGRFRNCATDLRTHQGRPRRRPKQTVLAAERSDQTRHVCPFKLILRYIFAIAVASQKGWFLAEYGKENSFPRHLYSVKWLACY
jgi:hypothetical protein